jgi:hypothetical protein
MSKRATAMTVSMTLLGAGMLFLWTEPAATAESRPQASAQKPNEHRLGEARAISSIRTQREPKWI